MIAALGPELGDDADTTGIIDVLLSFSAWSHLRLLQGLDVDTVLARTERAVLTQLGLRIPRD